MSPASLHCGEKKRNDVFILCCVCLCGKRGGNSHVALRYLFTPNTQPPNSSTETHNSAAGSPHATTTHNPNLSHPNLFRRNLRFTQIRLICPITTAPLGANYQICTNWPFQSLFPQISASSQFVSSPREKPGNFGGRVSNPFSAWAHIEGKGGCFTIYLRSSEFKGWLRVENGDDDVGKDIIINIVIIISSSSPSSPSSPSSSYHRSKC